MLGREAHAAHLAAHGVKVPKRKVATAPAKRARRPAPPSRFVSTGYVDDHVVVPVRIVSEANRRDGWRKGHERSAQQRDTVKLVLNRARSKPSLPCTIELTRIGPKTLDGDNLQRAAKACRDQIAAWLGVDDGDARVTWSYSQRSDGPRTYGLVIAWRQG